MAMKPITVENNAREALEMAKELLAIAKKKGDQAAIKSRQSQVRYWTKFLKDREAIRDAS